MNRHYQALCRDKWLPPGVNYGEPRPFGEPFTVRHILPGDPSKAIKDFTGMLEGEGYHVISVTELHPEVDWSKPVLDLDEAAALTGVRGSSLSAKKASGTIPWNTTANGVRTAVFLKSLDDGLNPCGQKIVRELERAN